MSYSTSSDLLQDQRNTWRRLFDDEEQGCRRRGSGERRITLGSTKTEEHDVHPQFEVCVGGGKRLKEQTLACGAFPTNRQAPPDTSDTRHKKGIPVLCCSFNNNSALLTVTLSTAFRPVLAVTRLKVNDTRELMTQSDAN